MRMKPLPIASLLVLTLMFASCATKSDIPVPKDAAYVIHLDGSSVLSKLSWDEIKQSDWYKIAREQTKDSLSLQVLNDPEVSGIDIKSDVYIFVKMQGRGAYSAVTGKLKDEKAFAAFVEKAMPGKTASKKGDLSVMSSEGSVLTWKSGRFVIINNNPEMNSSAAMSGMRSEEDNSFSQDSLVMFANQVYDLKGANSIGTDKRFADIIKEKGEMHFWINSSGIYKNGVVGPLALTKAADVMKDNVTGGTVNFDNGKINAEVKTYYNEKMEEMYRKYMSGNIDENMLKMIPSQNVDGVIAVKFSPPGLKEILVLLGVDGYVNSFLGKEGLSIEDIVRANKGDLLFAVTDFQVKNERMFADPSTGNPGYEMKKPDANMFVAMSVNDRAAFQKLLDVAFKMGGETGMAIMQRYPIVLNDKWFVAGSDSTLVNGFAAGTANIDHAFIAKIKGHPMGGYFDIQKFIQGARPGMDSTSAPIADEALKTWQDVVFYGGELKGNAAVSHFEVNMVDKGANSLKQLNNFISVVARVFHAQQSQRDAAMKDMMENYPPVMDTVVAPAPR